MVMEVDNNNDTENVKSTAADILRESSAEIVSGGHVFYNPVQEFNRDLSIAVLNVYFDVLTKERQEQKSSKPTPTDQNNSSPTEQQYKPGEKYDDGLHILEALSATGLRSIRYAKEIAGVRKIVANDLSRQAVESIRVNVQHNRVEHLVSPSHQDAMTLMYTSTKPAERFDVIDLDPYGCPNRFLDGAVQALKDGGLLLITATDMAVLAGNAPEACYVKYGAVPLRMKCCHEMALRILLHCVETHANRYGKYIVPLLSISVDFYIRVFVRVFASQAKCKYSMSKQSLIYQCTGCDTHTLQPLGIIKPNPTEQNPNQVKFGIPTGPPVNSACEHCGHRHHVGGPIWSAPIHDQEFVEKVLQRIHREPLCELGTYRRLTGVLTMVEEELPDVPLYYAMDKLCCILKMQNVPILKFRSALLYAGYRVSFSHACKNSIKTNAPAAAIWDVLRCWNKRHPVNEKRVSEISQIKAILGKPCEREYNFDELHPAANPTSRKNALSRFQENPTAFWGPGTRATIMNSESILDQNKRKQQQKQGKKQKQRETTGKDEENDVSDEKTIAEDTNTENSSKKLKLEAQ